LHSWKCVITIAKADFRRGTLRQGDFDNTSSRGGVRDRSTWDWGVSDVGDADANVEAAKLWDKGFTGLIGVYKRGPVDRAGTVSQVNSRTNDWEVSTVENPDSQRSWTHSESDPSWTTCRELESTKGQASTVRRKDLKKDPLSVDSIHMHFAGCSHRIGTTQLFSESIDI